MPCECIPIRRYPITGQRDDLKVQCCSKQSNQTVCTVSYNESFIGDNVTYLCNDGVPESDQEMCKKVLSILNVTKQSFFTHFLIAFWYTIIT